MWPARCLILKQANVLCICLYSERLGTAEQTRNELLKYTSVSGIWMTYPALWTLPYNVMSLHCSQTADHTQHYTFHMEMTPECFATSTWLSKDSATRTQDSLPFPQAAPVPYGPSRASQVGIRPPLGLRLAAEDPPQMNK